MSGYPPRRPTEAAAIAAAARSPRPLPALARLLAELVTANALGDRHGVNLLAHRTVRAVLGEVGE
ncbi:hypothetical protein ACFXIY_10795 [Streptomyces albidoflavus]